MTIELRDYQTKAKRDIYSFIRQGIYRILVMAPTGAGKSVIMAKIIFDALSRGKRILIVVHRKKLVSQLSGTIEALCGHKPALIAPKHKPDYDNPVQIAMAQTLRRRELPPDINILIGDEIHIVGYLAIWRKCLYAYCDSIWALSSTIVLGFTATPFRMKNKEGFCHIFQMVVKAPSPRELIKLGYLTNPRLFTYNLLDTTQLDTDADGEFTLASLHRTCTSDYNKDVLNKWEGVCKGKKTVIFCVSVAQAEDIAAQYQTSGYPSAVVTGKTGDKQAIELFQRFKDGEILILVSVMKLSEGFDETSIECAVIARPTRSPALLIQMIGRALRLHPGKDEVFILDCGGCFDWITNTKIKGYKIEDPIDITIAPLCPKNKKKEFNETKQCSCGAKLPVWAKICPECGHEFKSKEKPIPNTIQFPDLIEYFTEETQKQYTFVRKELVRHFQNKTNPNAVFTTFNRRFGILPPKDYCLGAIFGLNNPKENIEVYRHHLLGIAGIDRNMVEFSITLEFGEVGKTYKVANNPTYERPPVELNEFDPWQYLDIPTGSSESEIKKAYANKIKSATNKYALNYALTNCLTLATIR